MTNSLDIKKLQRIIEQIDYYKNKYIVFTTLIGSLEFLTSNIETEKIKEKIWLEWTKLEEYYAKNKVVYYREVNGFENNEIIETIDNIKKLAKSEIENYIHRFDSDIKFTAEKLDEKWIMCPNCNEAWEPILKDVMVFCPKCDIILHNPLSQKFG